MCSEGWGQGFKPITTSFFLKRRIPPEMCHSITAPLPRFSSDDSVDEICTNVDVEWTSQRYRTQSIHYSWWRLDDFLCSFWTHTHKQTNKGSLLYTALLLGLLMHLGSPHWNWMCCCLVKPYPNNSVHPRWKTKHLGGLHADVFPPPLL